MTLEPSSSLSSLPTNDASPINDSQGNRLSEKEDILACWKENFSVLLNQSGTANASILDAIPQQEILVERAAPPTIEEVKSALNRLANNKALGPDCIPSEILKAGGQPLLSELWTLFLAIWEEEKVPQDLKNGIIVTIFKKHCRFDFGNYRGITLLAVIGKLFARVILDRIWPCIEKYIPEAQCSFRGGRSTSDMMFALRQLLEKCREQHQELCTVLVKAFDTVSRSLMWALL